MKYQLSTEDREKLKAELAVIRQANSQAEDALVSQGADLSNPAIVARLELQAIKALLIGDNDDLALQYDHEYQRIVGEAMAAFTKQASAARLAVPRLHVPGNGKEPTN